MTTTPRRFRRADRVLTSREYRAVARDGRRSSSRAFVLLWAGDRGETRPRMGLTVSRRVGNAVVRNGVKRRVREWFRRGGRDALSGGRLIVIARQGAPDLSFDALRRQLDRQVSEISA